MKLATLTTTLALLAVPASVASADTTRDTLPPARVGDVALPMSRMGHDLIGRQVFGAAGEELGEIKDLVVDAAEGKLLYALVGSGGFLGINEALRAVPFAALRPSARDSRDLALAVDRARWQQAPTMPANRVDLLGDPATAKNTFAYYGTEYDDDFKARDARDGARLLRVSGLDGRDITNGGVKVGEIDDVVVHLASRSVLALLDPEDDYTGSDRKFLINFHQLRAGPDRSMTTTLTRDQFANVPSTDRNWWETTDERPLVWNGESSLNPVPYVATAPAGTVRATELDPARDHARASARTDLAVLRERIQGDRTLSERARRDVRLEERGGRLVVSGTVESGNVKDYVMDSVHQLARGWQIDDQLSVRAAAE